MNESNDEQTCQFFDGVQGNLVCGQPTTEGEDVCETHLTAYQSMTADD